MFFDGSEVPADILSDIEEEVVEQQKGHEKETFFPPVERVSIHCDDEKDFPTVEGTTTKKNMPSSNQNSSSNNSTTRGRRLSTMSNCTVQTTGTTKTNNKSSNANTKIVFNCASAQNSTNKRILGAGNFVDYDNDVWDHDHYENEHLLNNFTSHKYDQSRTTKTSNEGAQERIAQQKYASKICLDKIQQQTPDHSVKNSISAAEDKASQSKNIGISRDTRATMQQCLDERTLAVLHKFLNAKLINEINGCISTGKEANVYHAISRRELTELFPNAWALNDIKHLIGEDKAKGESFAENYLRKMENDFQGDMLKTDSEDTTKDGTTMGDIDLSRVELSDDEDETMEQQDQKEEQENSTQLEEEQYDDDEDDLAVNVNRFRAPLVAKGLVNSERSGGNKEELQKHGEEADRENKHGKTVTFAIEFDEEQEKDKSLVQNRKKNKTGKFVNADKATRLARDDVDGRSSTTSGASSIVSKNDKKGSVKGQEIGLAVKIFKTSILVFKDRARYTEGDYRFRFGCAKGNPRKMVAQWCEKEFRNLMRINQKAKLIKAPFPIEHRQNVLVMSLVGRNGTAAPRLKDVKFHEAEDEQLEWELMYLYVCRLVRDLFQNCKLVHGDLSEYNMLFDRNEVYIIDVSQSVEMDHPQALDFLKRDCQNVNTFFQRQGVECLTLRTFYQYVIDEEEADIDDLIQDQEAVDEQDEEEFKNTWVPSNLHQINCFSAMEKDMDKIERGETTNVSNLLAPSKEEQEERETRQAGGSNLGVAMNGGSDDEERDGGRNRKKELSKKDEKRNRSGSGGRECGKDQSAKKIEKEQKRLEKQQKNADKWRRYREKKVRDGQERRCAKSGEASTVGGNSVAGSKCTSRGQSPRDRSRSSSPRLEDCEITKVSRATSELDTIAEEDSTTSGLDRGESKEDEKVDVNVETTTPTKEAASLEPAAEIAPAVEPERLLPTADVVVSKDTKSPMITDKDMAKMMLSDEEAGHSDSDNEDGDGDGATTEEDGTRKPKKEKRLPEGSRDPNMTKAEWKAYIKQQREDKRLEKLPKKLKKKHKSKAK